MENLTLATITLVFLRQIIEVLTDDDADFVCGIRGGMS